MFSSSSDRQTEGQTQVHCVGVCMCVSICVCVCACVHTCVLVCVCDYVYVGVCGWVGGFYPAKNMIARGNNLQND